MEFEEFKIMYEAEDTHWWYRGLRGVMFQLLGLSDSRRRCMRILDAGCGTGGTLDALTDQGFTNLHGFDLNPPALLFCKQRGLGDVRIGSITDIPFENDTFDAVISSDVLCDAGTPNERVALDELYRVLKPGGRLFLNLPAFSFLRSEHDRATDVARRYTKREITGKLANAGFKIRRATYWNMTLFPIVLLVRIGRRENEADLKNPARSDILLPPGPLNAILSAILWFEHRLLRVTNLPFGSSVSVLAIKPRK